MLAQLRIRTVCDYRSRFEREREKTQWPGPQAPKILVLDIMSLNPDMAGKDPSRAFFDRLMKPALPPGILPAPCRNQWAPWPSPARRSMADAAPSAR